MKGEIIAIGDELLTGRIANTTSLFAAKRLFEADYSVKRMSIVGDVPEEIEEALNGAVRTADFVVITGGLGPTSDDLTTEVISRVLGRKLVFHNEIRERIEAFSRAKGQDASEELYKMAWLPERAVVLDDTGTAAGYFLEHDGKALFFLPGVPGQMRDLFDRKVLPCLASKWKPSAVIRQEIIKTFGLSESEINSRCAGLEKTFQRLKIGYYPDFPEVHITLTASCDGTCEAEGILLAARKELDEKLYPHIFGGGDDTMEKVVGDILRGKKLTLSIAESCTGGLVAQRLTRIPGSSDYFERGMVTYSNTSKIELLDVRRETLSSFGAVSAETAAEMARGIKERSRTDMGLSITGIAGPAGGTTEKPVGTVYIGMSLPDELIIGRFLFWGTREMIQQIAAETALDGLRRYLLE
ncbi:MAG: competence/damage-inducible protein A [Pseudomonadota bacterium]